MYPESISKVNLETRMQSFDWEHTFYDPLYFNCEATEPDEIEEINRLEELIMDLQKVADSGFLGRAVVEELTARYWKAKPMEDSTHYLFNDKKT
ncbi:MAG: hypothetical protein EOP48_21530, partial [Sphingobacteriales bacterium]